MNEMLKHLCMGEAGAIDFLERTLEAKNLVNELTGLAQCNDFAKLMSTAYSALDEILSPICLKCNVKAQRFITSPAQLFDPDMANYPGGSSLSWTGEWYCPQCRKVVAYGEKWWVQTSDETGE